MADRFIDQDETQIYGPYAARKIRRKVVGLIPAFDDGLEHLAQGIEDATAEVKTAIGGARGKDADHRQGVQQKTPTLKQAIHLLGRFSKHLDGHPRGAVDRKVYFVADGTAGGVGRGAQKVLLAVTHITSELNLATCPVRDRVTWHQEFSAMATAFAPVVEHADDARTDRRELTPEVEAARKAWMNVYLAARSGVECVLRLSGKLSMLPAIFYDLAVPAGAKVTSAPAEPEEEEAQDEGGQDVEQPEQR